MTAHDLRHSFATSLFSARYFNLNSYIKPAEDNWTLQALKTFCRPGIEGRAIRHIDDIRRLMGHASLEVTFERYIHSFDLTVADTIFQAENQMPVKYLNRQAVLDLTDVSERHSRRISTSKPKSSGVTEDDAFTPSDENDLVVLIASPDSTEEDGISPKKNRIFQIPIEKVEEWLKNKLLIETKKSLPVNKVLAKKTSTKRRSVIKKL